MNGERQEFRGSPRLSEPAELVGEWEIAADKIRCNMEFFLQPVESANAHRLVAADDCLASLVPGVVGWRPVPDGIELVGADRLAIALFAGAGAGTGGEAMLRNGTRATLARR